MTTKHSWHQTYEPGVPANIDKKKIVPLVDYLRHTATGHGKSPAFTNFGATVDFNLLEEQSRVMSAGLQSLGLQPIDRVAVMLPNVIQFPVALFGILRSGMTVVNVNPLYTPRELRHQLVDSGATAIIILENFAHVLEQVIADTGVQHVIVTRVGDHMSWAKAALLNNVLKYIKKMVPAWNIPGAHRYKPFLAQHQASQQQDYDNKLEDIAFLQYTGGTTGLSKGAVLTHRNVSANIQQGLAWCTERFKTGEEIGITALPLYHIFSLTANLMFMVATAGHSILITNPRDFKGFVKELRKWKFTYISGVNTLYAALMNTPGFEQIDFSALKITFGGGMAVTQPVARRWKKLTGKPLIQVYGLSETSPAVCMNRLDLPEFNGFVGLPVPSTDVIIANDDGQPVDIEEEGELCVKGPQVMPGYWQNEEETAKVFTEDGYFRTGDVAKINQQGYIKILDRKKDMILVSGFNVYPNEIEDVVSEHEGVLEVAAVGIKDEHSGERVKLYVVRKEAGLTEEALIAWCRDNMTNYKVPRAVAFFEELPKSNVGKILRRELRGPD